MKRQTLGIAAALVIVVSSTTASAATPIGNTNSKGSLLVYQRIDVSGNNDTLITLTNDSSGPVNLKCYYASSDPLATPNTLTAGELRPTKHFLDFTIDLTHNQPVSWWAKSGRAVGDSLQWSGQVAPPFGFFPDGANNTIGELKCFAVTNDGLGELHYNHLFGTASVWDAPTGQAFEYTATAFQAIGPSTMTGTALGSPGVLNLDNVEYDACPNILLGNYAPGGVARPQQTLVTLASCNQDLRQAYTPTVTKLTWTFWNQDEAARTGTHFCADSWYETDFPTGNAWFQSSYASLGTEAAYFRIETTADTQICGPDATTSAYVGVIKESFGGGYTRASNLTGRGVARGVITWDPGIPDSFKR